MKWDNDDHFQKLTAYWLIYRSKMFPHNVRIPLLTYSQGRWIFHFRIDINSFVKRPTHSVSQLVTYLRLIKSLLLQFTTHRIPQGVNLQLLITSYPSTAVIDTPAEPIVCSGRKTSFYCADFPARTAWGGLRGDVGKQRYTHLQSINLLLE